MFKFRTIFCLTLTIALLTVGSAQAATTLESGWGYEYYLTGFNVEGFFVALDDPDFSESGDPLSTPTAALTSVGLLRDGDTGSAGDLYLKGFTGTAGGTGTHVGNSTNTIDVLNTPNNTKIYWSFDNLVLTSSAQYSYVLGNVNDSSNEDEWGRFGWNTNQLPTTGGYVDSGDSGYTGYTPMIQITTAPIPEPSTMALLIAGCMAALAFARRRK